MTAGVSRYPAWTAAGPRGRSRPGASAVMSLFLLLGTVGYVAGMPLAARLFYALLRRQIIFLDGRERTDPVGYFETHDRPGATAAAVAAGLLWPLTVPVYAVGRGVVAAVTARPRRSSYERRLDSRQVQERIRELEEGLGMPDDDPAHRGQPRRAGPRGRVRPGGKY